MGSRQCSDVLLRYFSSSASYPNTAFPPSRPNTVDLEETCATKNYKAFNLASKLFETNPTRTNDTGSPNQFPVVMSEHLFRSIPFHHIISHHMSFNKG
jgi:hypothetical protein